MTKSQLWNICSTAMSMKAVIVFIYKDGTSKGVHTSAYDYVSAPDKRKYITFMIHFDKENYVEIDHEKVYQISMIIQ